VTRGHLTLPGIRGKLHVSFPMHLIPLGFIPAKGFLPLAIQFPANFPVPATYPMQALIGLQLTDPHIVTVQ